MDGTAVVVGVRDVPVGGTAVVVRVIEVASAVVVRVAVWATAVPAGVAVLAVDCCMAVAGGAVGCSARSMVGATTAAGWTTAAREIRGWRAGVPVRAIPVSQIPRPSAMTGASRSQAAILRRCLI